MSYTRQDLVSQSRQLSSGTIASLTGKVKYAEIDPIHAEFEEFCMENQGKYETWVEAWNDYKKVSKLTR